MAGQQDLLVLIQEMQKKMKAMQTEIVALRVERDAAHRAEQDVGERAQLNQ